MFSSPDASSLTYIMTNAEQNLPSATAISKEAGLVVFGAATGLLLSGVIGENARKPVGLILGLAGIAAAGPEIAKLISKAVNDPSTKHGSKKTLEGIRSAAGKPVKPENLSKEDYNEGMFIG